MLNVLIETQNKEKISEFIKLIERKGYFPSRDFDDYEDYEMEMINSGKALQADASGAFSDVFFIEDVALKMHSRFDFGEEFDLEYGYTAASGTYDFEVLKGLPKNEFAPKLIGHGIVKHTHFSIVERVDGVPLKVMDPENIDFGNLKDFLINGHKLFFKYGWVPMDISSANIFATEDGFKFIDFSCFHNEQNMEDADMSTYENICEVMASEDKLREHVENIIINIKSSASHHYERLKKEFEIKLKEFNRKLENSNNVA